MKLKNVNLALKINKIIHNECKDVPNDRHNVYKMEFNSIGNLNIKIKDTIYG